MDRWVIMTPEDESVTLHQFLRFGETKSSAELMISLHQQLPLSPNISKPTPQLFPNTSQTLQMNGINKGKRSPKSIHLENVSGGTEECSYSSSSLLYQFPEEFCKLQRHRGETCGEKAESPAAIVTNPSIRREERKHRGNKNSFFVSKTFVSIFHVSQREISGIFFKVALNQS